MARIIWKALILTIILVLAPAYVLVQAQPALTATLQETLASHWVPGWGFRDELNASDTDYQNFWTDNAGKILSMAMTTGDASDASYALTFLESQGLGSSSSYASPYYLPEVRVNSSIVESQDNTLITNRIVQLVVNSASSNLQSLAIGNYYAGSTTMGYLGSDRVFVSGNPYRSISSTVLPISGGFSKKSFFETSYGDFYLYLNATLTVGEPYADVSIQVLPLNSSLSSNNLLYLQVFSSSGQFGSASLYGPDGSFLGLLAYDNGSPSVQAGLIIPYSQQFSVSNEDSVAVSFNNSTATVNVLEHWYQNPAFDNLSWIGIGYNAPANSVGVLSQPIYAKVYPLEHLDYRLMNDTAGYIASNPVNVAVSPPVSFGFVSYGLALEAAANPQNATLTSLALGYWNYYYNKYNSSDYSTAYSRSISLLALAGFKLYGSNSTVESFTRDFVGKYPGSSIEEYGWAAAALYQLYQYTGLQGDNGMYQGIVNAFVPNSATFLTITPNLPSEDYIFQLGEAASGLLLGGVQFNNPIVLDGMHAMYQSNVDGTILNQPYQGDLANTEGLPAYMLSTFLFQQEMKNATGYWISSLQDCNLTSILYSNGLLVIGANGSPGGSVTISGHNGSTTYSVNKLGSVILVETPSSKVPTITIAEILAVGVLVGIAVSALCFVLRRKR